MRRPDFRKDWTVKRIALLSALMIILVGATGVVFPSMALGGARFRARHTARAG